uniref:Cadherin domain-containing protein n=1 Tax=Trichobilharzia regenti TaxID=157069 RepID=A0AA85JU80_TRIRE|nr:unnamed protein product [Trichobilharzia regenti]
MFIVNNNNHIFSFRISIFRHSGFILNYVSILLFCTVLILSLDIMCCLTIDTTSEEGPNIPKYVRIKIREESPSGTVILNIREFLNSGTLSAHDTDENGNHNQKKRLSIVMSSLNVVYEVASVNRLFRLNKETESIITNMIIDRDTLCSKDRLCCSNPLMKNNNGYFDTTSRISPSSQMYKSYYSKTADLCLIQFRVIFSMLYDNDMDENPDKDTNRNDQAKSTREEMGYITVDVELIDINDNSPQFILPSGTSTDQMPKTVILLYNPVPVVEISVEESTSLHSCILLPKAFDPDSSTYDVSEYRLESLSPSDIVTLKHKLSYSNLIGVDKYELPFTLEQKGCITPFPMPYNEVNMNTAFQETEETLEIQSSNEQLIPSLKVTGYLDREVNEYFWIKLLAVDGIRYFHSDVSNGQDLVNNNNSFSNGKNILQTPKHTGTILIRIHILDVNDNTPVVPRTLNLEVSEDAKIGTLLGRINGSDPDFGDNGRLHYRLMIDSTVISSFPFAVDSQTGIITVNRPLDADRLPPSDKHMRFKIMTSDFGKPKSHSAYTAIDVRINDINDESPQIKVIDLESRSNPPYPTLMENRPPGQLVAFVTATDADSGFNGALSCRINNPKFKLEQISTIKSHSDDHLNGKTNLYNFDMLNSQSSKQYLNILEFKMVTSVELDREASAIEVVEIICIDQPLNSATVRTGTTQFFVTVLDENDNPPTFNTNKFQLDILENTPPDEIIFAFNATDPDYQNYLSGGYPYRINDPSFHSHNQHQNIQITQSVEKIKYSIDSQGQQYFRVDADTGILYNKVIIDRKTINEIRFNVTATDNGRPPKNVTAEVFINIIDQNDHAPQFEKQIFYFNLSEDFPVNSIAATLIAHDDDIGENAEITYKIDDLQGNAMKTFKLDRNNGTLWLRTPLDREKLDNYAFKVVATDNGIPKHSSSCQVHIKVHDVNDNAPKFVYPTHSNHTVYASVFTNPGVPLVKLTATDADEGINSQLTFYLLEESNEKQIFMVDPNSGELSLLPVSDPYSIEGRHELKFEVRDSGTPSLSGYANINIILDHNSPPLASFNNGKYQYSNMELLQSRNAYRSPMHKTDDESIIYASVKKENDASQLRQDISNKHGSDSIYAQPIASSSLSTNDNIRRKEKISAISNQKASTQFNLEKIWIIIICLIAISTLVAFAFLVAITLTRQKMATYEIRQPSNHLNETMNLYSTDQCGSSQLSMNTHRISNMNNTYSPTKYRTLEKVDHLSGNSNSNNNNNNSQNLYSAFIKYDTNADSNMGSPHQLRFCPKDLTTFNMDMETKPVYNYNMPVTINSLQFKKKFLPGENRNNLINASSEKCVPLMQVQFSAPASPNEYFTQRYKTIDQRQMNIPCQKYETLQPHKCDLDKSNHKIPINHNTPDSLLKLNDIESSPLKVMENNYQTLKHSRDKSTGILKGRVIETNETANNNKKDESFPRNNNDADAALHESCSSDSQRCDVHLNKINGITSNKEELQIQMNNLITNSTNKSDHILTKVIYDPNEHNHLCQQQQQHQQAHSMNRSQTEHNLLVINSKYSPSNDIVTSLASHVSTFI